MRTTIELPDDLFRSAKIAAAERGSTLRQLVIQGLKRTLSETPEQPNANKLPKLPSKGRKSYDLSNDQIESILLNENASPYGRSR